MSILNILHHNHNMEKFCDAVFEGGGVRGIGYVGAISMFENAGYTFRNLAGSSAGAIIAALIAAGFTSQEMHDELVKMDFESFKETGILGSLGTFGNLINATKHFGMYKASMFEKWLDELLERKNVRTFADLHGRLRVTATDVTEEKTIILPDDLKKFGIDENTFRVSTAVRMSMGIPVFYEPYELRDKNDNVHYIVDGGLLSNYPIWILDNGRDPMEIPVIGFRFIHHPGQIKSKKPNIVSYIKQIITTFIESGDADMQSVVKGDAERTVFVDTMVEGKNIGITDFNITKEQVESLFKNGIMAGEKFLKDWDFKNWSRRHR